MAVTGRAGRAGEMIGTIERPVTGRIETGSSNVFINRHPAAMKVEASGLCS